MNEITNEEMGIQCNNVSSNTTDDDYVTLTSTRIKLEKGQCLEGELIEIEETLKSPVLHFRTKQGCVSIWSTAQLEEVILERYIGCFFKIVYIGIEQVKEGKRLHKYIVQCKGGKDKMVPQPPTIEEKEGVRKARQGRKDTEVALKKILKDKFETPTTEKKRGGKK